MRPLKAIGAGLCALLLVPVLVIGAAAGDLDNAFGGLDAQSISADRAELQDAVLAQPRIALTAEGRADVVGGRVDVRILEVLLVVAQTHRLGPVGPFVTGHGRLVAGTGTVSNHVYGRAVDIAGVDGVAVSVLNLGARAVMVQILAFAPPLLPDELGGPWPLAAGSVRVFTHDHHDHIHIGWDR